MTDTQELNALIEVHIAERDQATRDATNQLIAAALDLDAAIGKTPYVTTLLQSVADITQVVDKLAGTTDKANRWLEINAAVADAAPPIDVNTVLRDLKRDLKGLTATLHQQHRNLHRSVSRAWSLISHREGVVGREVL